MVDASVWISRHVPSETYHETSAAWLRQYLGSGHRVIAPTLLLVEIAGAFARRTGNDTRTRQIVALLRRLPGLHWVSLNPALRDRAADLAITLRLRGTDAVYVAVAERLRLPLITWDAEQLTRTSGRIPVRTPAVSP